MTLIRSEIVTNGPEDKRVWFRRILARGGPPSHALARDLASVDRLELLDGGEQAYPLMLEAIERARSHVYLEVYSFASTGVGARFVSSLAQAAQRGLDVRVIIDGWGSALSGRSIASTLRGAGCYVRIYHRLSALFRGHLSRTHRKVLLVDDEIAFVGGVNIGDENLSKPDRPAWADLALQIQGPHAAWLGRLFRKERNLQVANGLWIDVSGLRGGLRLRRHYVRAFKAARQSIQLAHAYFLPDRSLVRCLIAAARRGVEVNLVLAGHSDVPLVRAATRSLYRRLLLAGIHIHEWTGSVLHAKVACVDGCKLLIGSFNLDPFSLVNREILVQVTDPVVVAGGEHWIQRLLLGSRNISAIQAESFVRRWIYEPMGVLVAKIVHALGRLVAGRKRGFRS